MIHPRSLLYDDLIDLVPGSMGSWTIYNSNLAVWTLDGSAKVQLWHGPFIVLGKTFMILGPSLSVLKDDIFYQVYKEKLMKINLPSIATF